MRLSIFSLFNWLSKLSPTYKVIFSFCCHTLKSNTSIPRHSWDVNETNNYLLNGSPNTPYSRQVQQVALTS